MRNCPVQPELVAGRHRAPERDSAALVDQPHNRFAVHRRGNGAAEFHVAEPLLFPHGFRGRLRAGIVQIEEKKIVLEAGTGVGHGVAARLARKYGKIFRAEPADEIGLARLKAEHLRIRAGNKQEDELVEIRQPVPFRVRLPILAIPFQHKPLASYVLFQSERTHARALIGGCRETPELTQLAVLIGLLQKMSREDGEAVE